MFIKVPTREGEAVIAVQHIVLVDDLQRDEKNPERGAVIHYQVSNETYRTNTTWRAAAVMDAIEEAEKLEHIRSSRPNVINTMVQP